VGDIAERAQEIGLLARGARQGLAVAHARHRGAARLGLARRARDVMEIPRPLRVGHVHERRAVRLDLAGERVQALAAVVADVGDPSPVLLVDDRLVGRAGLEIVQADQAHVALLGRLPAGGPEQETAQQQGAPPAHGLVSVGIDVPPLGPSCGIEAGSQPTRRPAERSMADPDRHFPRGAARAMPTGP
jgi:hypothetical protein